MVVLVAWSKVVAFRGAGEWTCSDSGKTDCWSTRKSCYRCGVPRYFDGTGMGQGHFGAGPGKGVPGFQGQGFRVGMSGGQFFPRVSFQGAGRRFRRFVRAASRMGVADLLDARTILRVMRMGLFLVLVALDAARLGSRVFFA